MWSWLLFWDEQEREAPEHSRSQGPAPGKRWAPWHVSGRGWAWMGVSCQRECGPECSLMKNIISWRQEKRAVIKLRGNQKMQVVSDKQELQKLTASCPAYLHVWLCSVKSDSCDPTDCSPPGSSVHGVLQARILEWVTISSSRNRTQVSFISCIGRWIFFFTPDYLCDPQSSFPNTVGLIFTHLVLGVTA